MPFVIDTNTVFPVTIPDATEARAGLMSAADKIKLDSLTPGGGGTLAESYAAGESAADQTLVIDPVNGGAVVFERDDILLNLGYAYTAIEILNTTPAGIVNTRQNSPVIRLGGQVRVSEPSNMSVAVDWLTQVEVTGSGASPAADLVFSYGIDGTRSERVRFSQTRGFMLLDGTGINVASAAEDEVLAFDGDNFVPTPISALLSGVSIASGSYPYRAIGDADYACVGGDCYINADSWTTGHLLTLPLASTGAGRIIIFANGNGSSTVNAAGGNTIDGSAEKYPGAFTVWTFVSNGASDWRVVSVLTSVP